MRASTENERVGNHAQSKCTPKPLISILADYSKRGQVELRLLLWTVPSQRGGVARINPLGS